MIEIGPNLKELISNTDPMVWVILFFALIWIINAIRGD